MVRTTPRETRVVYLERMVYLGNFIARELHVDDRTDYLYDSSATHYQFLSIIKFCLCGRSLDRGCAADDLRQFLCNGRLAKVVHEQ